MNLENGFFKSNKIHAKFHVLIQQVPHTNCSIIEVF